MSPHPPHPFAPRSASPVHIIGMPLDFGQTLRGVDMGPSALRVAGLVEKLGSLGLPVVEGGDISCDIMATKEAGEARLRFLPAIAEACTRLAGEVARVVAAGHFPLVLGGDHSVSIGTLAGLATHDPRQGLIWFDAHGDFNSADTTPSGNIHGMALALVLGHGDPRLAELGGIVPKAIEENTVLVGVRDLDPGERTRLRDSRITVFTMRDVDEQGIDVVMRRAIEIATRGVDRLHLSLDVDVIDPDEAPGVGTPVPGGITFREAHHALEVVADSGLLTSMEVVEINPTLDVRNRTAELAVGLVGSSLGQRIL